MRRPLNREASNNAKLHAFFMSMREVNYLNITKYIVYGLANAKLLRKVVVAYCKLLFPNVKLDELSVTDLDDFKVLYNKYCLQPAIEARDYIYQQCKLADHEFKLYGMSMFEIK